MIAFGGGGAGPRRANRREDRHRARAGAFGRRRRQRDRLPARAGGLRGRAQPLSAVSTSTSPRSTRCWRRWRRRPPRWWRRAASARRPETRIAYMRYVGQGHEIPVPFRRAADSGGYSGDPRGLRGRVQPLLRSARARIGSGDHELRRVVATVATMPPMAPRGGGRCRSAEPVRPQMVRDTATGEVARGRSTSARRCARRRFAGPAIVAEAETSTLFGAGLARHD